MFFSPRGRELSQPLQPARTSAEVVVVQVAVAPDIWETPTSITESSSAHLSYWTLTLKVRDLRAPSAMLDQVGSSPAMAKSMSPFLGRVLPVTKETPSGRVRATARSSRAVVPVFLTRTVSQARLPPSTVLRRWVVVETPGQLAPQARSMAKAARRATKAVAWPRMAVAVVGCCGWLLWWGGWGGGSGLWVGGW